MTQWVKGEYDIRGDTMKIPKRYKKGDIVFMVNELDESETVTEIAKIDCVEGELNAGIHSRNTQALILQTLENTCPDKEDKGYEDEVYDVSPEELRIMRKATKKEVAIMHRYRLTRSI